MGCLLGVGPHCNDENDGAHVNSDDDNRPAKVLLLFNFICMEVGF